MQKKIIVSTLLKKILPQQGSLEKMTNLLFHRKINNLHNFLSVVYQYSKIYHTENGDEIKLKSLSHGQICIHGDLIKFAHVCKCGRVNRFNHVCKICSLLLLVRTKCKLSFAYMQILLICKSCHVNAK